MDRDRQGDEDRSDQDLLPHGCPGYPIGGPPGTVLDGHRGIETSEVLVRDSDGLRVQRV